MNKGNPASSYSPDEERLNVFSHATGFVFSVVAAFLLGKRSLNCDTPVLTVGYSAFAGGLLLLYAASTCYHYARNKVWRFRWKVLDHIAIFVLIAGTYTPFALVTLPGILGWTMFAIAWSIAVLGTILKIFFTGHYKLLSTVLYIGMGWMIIFFINPLLRHLPWDGLWWLFAGGVSYTLGGLIYNLNRLKFNHAIFHVFVLVGSFSHFMAVYGYVHLPVC